VFEDIGDVCAGILIALEESAIEVFRLSEIRGRFIPPGFLGFCTPLMIGGSSAWYSTATVLWFVGVT